MSMLNNVIQIPQAARQGIAMSIEPGARRCPFTEWTSDQGRIFEKLFAIDTETTKIDENNSQVVPAMVLASACDGVRGVFIGRDQLPAFFQAHSGSAMICHNAPFDLKVMQLVLGRGLDLYQWVEQGRVWDTQILRRLLSLATEGHTARGQSSLARSVRDCLGLELPKDDHDDDGCKVRTGFGRISARHLSTFLLEASSTRLVIPWRPGSFSRSCTAASRRCSRAHRTYGDTSTRFG